MPVTVSLQSEKNGEIKKFLERFYEKQIMLDDDVTQWIYIYNKPLDALDIISALADNDDDYELTMHICIDDWKEMKLSQDNHNNIIKSILFLYYEE